MTKRAANAASSARSVASIALVPSIDTSRITAGSLRRSVWPTRKKRVKRRPVLFVLDTESCQLSKRLRSLAQADLGQSRCSFGEGERDFGNTTLGTSEDRLGGF
jgi:hypothetical protein